jgi:hypothetical protein
VRSAWHEASRHTATEVSSLARRLHCLRAEVVLMIRLQHVLLISYFVLSSTSCWVHAEADHPHPHEEHRGHEEVIVHPEDSDGHHDEHHDHDHHD